MEKDENEINKIFFEMRNSERERKGLSLLETPSWIQENTLPHRRVAKFLDDINAIQRKHGLQLHPDTGDIIVRGGTDSKEFTDIEQNERGQFQYSKIFKAMMNKSSESAERDAAETDAMKKQGQQAPPPMQPKPEKNPYANEGLDALENQFEKFLIE